VRLLVSLSGLGPGVPLAAAVDCCDALDARRVPLTLLVGPRPHPEVAAFAAARRRAGDAVLLRGFRSVHDDARPYRRLRVLEARLRLAGATRSAEALGLGTDGFAAPGWSVSDGTRRAVAEAGLGVLLDDTGVHRLGREGLPTTGVAGPVVRPGDPAPSWLGMARARRRGAEPALRHLTADLAADGAAGVGALVGAVDLALADGAVPAVPAGLVGPAHRPRRPAGGALDPELWSTTA
jgi:predicted deacetylase